jgi:hypothetical protein
MSEPEVVSPAKPKPAGKVQRRVIECLQAAGRWRWLADVVAELFPEATRSQTVVVRKAVRTLATRGEVCTGSPAGETRRYLRRTAVWLSSQAGPSIAKALPSREEVAGDILEFLKSLDAVQIAQLRVQWPVPSWSEYDPHCYPVRRGVPWLADSRHVHHKHWDKAERREKRSETQTLLRRALGDLERDGRAYAVRSSDGKRTPVIYVGLGSRGSDG